MKNHTSSVPSPSSPSSTPSTPSIHDFATWEPVLRLLLASRSDRTAGKPMRVAGRIGRSGWSLALKRPVPSGRAMLTDDIREELDAVERVQSAMSVAKVEDISFTAVVEPSGKTALSLLGPSPAVEPGLGNPHPGALLLVEDAVPEPWRRLPEPTPAAVPAPSADPGLLERTLRERLPGAIGATDEEIAAVEARLGIPLPDELRALYRVVRARWTDWAEDDHDGPEILCRAVNCELSAVDDLHIADAASRHFRWEHAAMQTVDTPPDAAVQGLVGSPGWIVFGDNGGGDRLAVDLTPGPGGHLGQVIMIGHEESTGAALLADSLTDFVLGRPAEERRAPRTGPSGTAWVNRASTRSIEEAAHPGLEALSLGVWDEAPFSLAPLAGLPRLRTLTAYADTLADPLEISALPHLEFLSLSPDDWRTLLAADAVPRTLLAAAITTYGSEDTLTIVSVANDLLALWGRPQIIRTTLDGDLGPQA
ncbi:SMI1/KNR4 family protein [Streptomyces bambusae]|uniref:SMI1/KNR4 family protein n=1 Tax=Streptomyces bambusae TaxID=1550616 RepID=UPI001CFCB633|nr:SMI1/KNR4 family protein [Streptomyces bambusae]MCB5166493.1 SMI1/KNR4 family protein [Streptomyces bambusae]